MNSFFSHPRTALAPLFLVLAIGNSGCGGSVESGSSVAGSGGTGGTGATGGTGGDFPSPACTNPDVTDFAELTAPPGDSFEEAVIAATDTEVGLAYTQWHDETRDVTVYLQRFGLDGKPLGDPVALHTFNEGAGQFAAGDFYGQPSIATDGSRFVTCWGEANALGCAAVATGSGAMSFHAVLPLEMNGFAYAPHVTFGPSGFRVFFVGNDIDNTALALDEQASPTGDPATPPGTVAVEHGSGYAVVARNAATVFFLGADLAQQGEGIDTPSIVNGIAWTSGKAAVVGGRSVTFVTPGGPSTTIEVASQDQTHPMAVAARKSAVGVVWSSSDEVLRFDEVDPSGAHGQKGVGCAAFYNDSVRPSIAAVPDGYLFAAARPEGEHELFYAKGYPRIRVTHLAMP